MRGGALRAVNESNPAQFPFGRRARRLRTATPRPALAVFALVLRRLHAFARDVHGGAAIELALGAMVFVSTTVLCVDLYSRIKADTAVARLAATMADYVSRDADPDGDEMEALGDHLRKHELAVPADLVYVVSAFHQPSGDPRPAVVVLWSDDSIRFGDPTVTTDLAAGCARYVDDGGLADLPADFTMADDEVLIVAEVCARLTGRGFITAAIIAGDIYRLHALPARDPDRQPAEPVYAMRERGGVTVAAIGATAGAAAGVHEPAPAFVTTAASA